MSQTIYGGSDDLIELVGDIVEEFAAPYGRPFYLALSTGDLLHAEYSHDGVWTFRMAGGLATPDHITIHPARGEDEGNDDVGCPGYSQKVVIEPAVDPVRWVALAETVELRK